MKSAIDFLFSFDHPSEFSVGRLLFVLGAAVVILIIVSRFPDPNKQKK